MKKLLSSIVFTLLFASNSIAEVSVGIAAANYGFYAFGKETVSPGTGQEITEESGAFEESTPIIFLEYDGGAASIGLEIITDTIETPETINENPAVKSGNRKVKGEFKNHVTMYGIIPVPTPFFSGMYLKAGLGMVDIKGIDTGTTSNYPETDTTFITAGFGYQYDAPNGIFVRAEVSAAQYDDVSVTAISTSSFDGSKNTLDFTDMLSANGRIAVGKSF